MAYLEVRIQHGTKGMIASSANGCSLAKSNGFLAFFFGSSYPMLDDYIDALEYEGWTLVSSGSSSVYGMIDGLPFANVNEKLYFRGNGRYLIEWTDDTWHLARD